MNIESQYNSDSNPNKKHKSSLENNNSIFSQNEHNNFFQIIFDQSNAITLIINPQCGTIVQANQSAVNFYKYPKEELIGKQISEINILDKTQIKKEMDLARTEQRNFFNFQHRLQSGEIKHVEVFSNPIQLGDQVFLHSTIHESEEKTNLKSDSNKFRDIASQSPVTIVITDLEGKINYVNPKFTELTGYSEEEAIGQNPRILKTDLTPKSTFSNMWKTISAGKNWSGEFINKRKNGEFFYERAHISPLYEEGIHSGYLAIKEDITEQVKYKKKVEDLNSQLTINLDELHAAYEELNTINETLKEEREQFLSLLNSIPEPIYVTEKDTNIILFANNKINEVVGRNIVGEKCYKTIQNKNEKCDFCKSDKVIKEKSTYFWENYNSALKKHYYIIDRHITWINGEDAHFQMSIDISKLKEIELELRKTQDELRAHRDQLVESNATKDKFFSIISHDLKNPFNSIMGLANFLHEKIDKYDKETISKYAYHIYEASRSSYKLLQNLLEWSRAQMGQISFNPEVQNLANLIDNATASSYNQAQAKNIKINFDINYTSEVYADSNMLSTIIRNLLSNAIKFSPKGKSIVISGKSTDKTTTISIKDEGKGIPQKTLEKLFKISEKVTTPGTENEKGTGLGLLLCKEFADAHKGKILVESEEGKGSVFTIELPVK
jgi:PAS domain S-box-containing protein